MTPVADSLLDDERVARLGSDGFLVIDDFLGLEHARTLRDAVRQLCAEGALHPAGMSRGDTHRIERASRGDEIAWLDPSLPIEPLRRWLDRLEAIRDEVNRTAYLGLRRYEVMAARYPGGGARYVRHLDAFPGGPNRTLTVLYYLNEGWEPDHGGALRIYPAGREPLELEPRMDRLLLFLSAELEHEVLPTWKERFSLTTWFYGREDLPR